MCKKSLFQLSSTRKQAFLCENSKKAVYDYILFLYDDYMTKAILDKTVAEVFKTKKNLVLSFFVFFERLLRKIAYFNALFQNLKF